MIPEFISRSDAVTIIAERTKPAYRELRGWKNIINEQIKSRLKKGLIRQRDNLLNAADIAVTLQKFYSEDVFEDWPKNNTAFFVERQGGGCDFLIMTFPKSLDECHEKMEKMYKEIHFLKMEIESLRPDANRFREIKEQNKINGKKEKNVNKF
jgi:hypothetical protein